MRDSKIIIALFFISFITISNANDCVEGQDEHDDCIYGEGMIW